jgi:hypothetical protein
VAYERVKPTYFRQEQEIFLFLKGSRIALGPTQCPIQLVHRTVFTRIIRPERETDQSDASSAKVINAWSYTAFTPYVFITLTGILLIETFLIL